MKGRGTMLWAWGLALTWWVVSAAAQFTFSDLAFMARVAGVSTGGDVPNAPPTEGLVLWYRANDSNAMANNTTFNYIHDKSGLGNHSTNLSGRGGPVLSNNVINGKSAFSFNGNGTMGMVLKAPPFKGLDSGQIETLWIVRNMDELAPSSINRACLASWEGPNMNGAGWGATLQGYQNLNKWADQMGKTNASYAWPEITNRYVTNWHVYSMRLKTNEQLISIDGHVVAGMDRVQPTGVTNMYLGIYMAGSFANFRGDIAEVIIYSNHLSEADRTVAYRYLSNQYGLNLSQSVWNKVWYPTNFPGLWGWWSAESFDGQQASGTQANTWADLSGNGRNWTNASATTAPTYSSNLYNGHSALVFDPTKPSWLTCTARLTNVYSAESWLIAVHRLTNANAWMFINSLYAVYGGYRLNEYYSGSPQWDTINHSGWYPAGPYVVSTNDLRVNAWAAQQRYPGETGAYNRLWRNSQYGADTMYYMGGDWIFDRIGAGSDLAFPAGGEICEMIWYQGHLDHDAYAKLFFTYLKPKWGIP